MSLIDCPDCGAEISRSAPTCPQCGRPITPAKQPNAEIRAKSGVSDGFRIGCGIVLAILLNEVNTLPLKKTIQTVVYFPHFLLCVSKLLKACAA